MASESERRRSPEVVADKLSQVLAIKAQVAEHLDYDSASRLFFTSLVDEETRLTEELHAAMEFAVSPDLDVVFRGGAVEGHAIHAGFLASALGSIQDLVTAMAQVKLGQPTDRAAVPASISDSYRLSVSAFAPGSFEVRMRLPEEPEQLQMIPGTGRQEVVDAVAELFTEEAVEGIEHVEKFLVVLRHARVKSHYQKLLGVLSSSDSDMTMRTKTMPEPVLFTKVQARQRMEWLELNGIREETLHLVGVLVGGNVESNHYDLTVGEDHYSGRMTDMAATELHGIKFGATVKADVRMLTHYHEDAIVNEKIEYELEHIESVGS